MSALSDSTTTTASPLLMASPSPLSQETILPSVMVEESAGMWISFTSALAASARAARTVLVLLSDLREPEKAERADARDADCATADMTIEAFDGERRRSYVPSRTVRI